MVKCIDGWALQQICQPLLWCLIPSNWCGRVERAQSWGATTCPFFSEEVWLFGLKCSPLLNWLCNTFLSLTGHDTGCKPIKQTLQEAAVQMKGMWAWGRKCTFICIVMPEEHGDLNLWHSSRISQQDCACLTHCLCWESRGKASSNLNSNDSTVKKR